MSGAEGSAPLRDARDLIEVYYEKGWTDGLPVVPPTEASVGAMLASAGLRGEEVVGEIPDRHVRLTADKAAINAVLAGCLPEYMPVVVAALKGICHPDYCYHGAATSTGGAAVAVIVNGPIAARLDINATDNVLGPGFRPNATIGRAVRLTMMNAINTRPGKLDRSTMGNPGKYSLCFAENEGASPWEPLHVERGFRAEESTATVFAVEALIQVYNQLSNTAEQLLLPFADAMSNLGSMNIAAQGQVMVLFAGEHCETLRSSGWSKRQIRDYLYGHARRTLADLKRVGRLAGPVEPGDADAWRHPVKTPEDIVVLSAGGAAGAFSTLLMGWGSSSNSRSITTPVVEG
ncbi:MAG: hypothetical protein IIA40_13720 [SAR324 cluster bacterium]|nr:hypothetical protein [SAR324 cluster bacterium]